MPFTVMGNRRRTILIVDGDPHFRASLRSHLESAGFVVGEAANSREAERTAMRVRPDAILLEMMLEGLDSGHLLAQRWQEVGEKFPIYILSRSASSLSHEFNWREEGIAGFFEKPINAPLVVETLLHCLH